MMFNPSWPEQHRSASFLLSFGVWKLPIESRQTGVSAVLGVSGSLSKQKTTQVSFLRPRFRIRTGNRWKSKLSPPDSLDNYRDPVTRIGLRVRIIRVDAVS